MALERERERESVHLKNKCFVKNTLFGVVEKSEEQRKEKSTKIIKIKKATKLEKVARIFIAEKIESVNAEKANKIEEKERMDYNINILKGVFMLI